MKSLKNMVECRLGKENYVMALHVKEPEICILFRHRPVSVKKIKDVHKFFDKLKRPKEIIIVKKSCWLRRYKSNIVLTREEIIELLDARQNEIRC